MAVAWLGTIAVSPARFAAGTSVLDSDAQDVIYASNWAAGQTPITLIAWDNRHLGLSNGFTFTDSNEVLWRFRVYLPPHLERVTASAVFVLDSGSATCSVTVEVGADSIVLSRTSSGTQTGNETIANTGSGVQTVEVTCTRTSGAGTMRLVALHVWANTTAATSLPTPEDE